MLLLDFGVMSVEDLRSGRLQGASRPELSYPLYEFLRSLVPLQAYAVLIIDEAQNLAPQLLEEIRILADLEAPEKLLQLVLVGQPELRTKIKDHSMRQLDQRVSVRVELTALDRPGVGEYIAHRLNVAGGGTDRVTFSDDAVEVIYRATKGNPRLINLTCDKALHHGHLARTFTIGPDIVLRSLVELSLVELTTPAATAPAAAPSLTSTPLAAPAMASPASAAPVSASARPSAAASAPVAPALASSHTPAPVQAKAAAPMAAPAAMPPDPEPDPDESEDDFGLSEKFFERPRQPTDEMPPIGELPPEMFGSTGAQTASSRRRTILIIVICLLAPALVALAVWMWQQNRVVDNGAIPAPPTAPLAEQAAQPAQISQPVDQVVAADTPSQSFEVGVALFAGYERANRLAVALAASGFRAITRPIESPEGLMYEVRTGPYLSRDAAETDAAAIRKLPGYGDARVMATSTPVAASPAAPPPVAAVPPPAPVTNTPPPAAP
jgi:cell division septation protein DedD